MKLRCFILHCLAFSTVCSASAQTRTLRIVTYNIAADVDGATTALPGLIAPSNDSNNVTAGGVLEGIGEEILGVDPAQPLDILALEETTSNPVTVTPIANALNAYYNTSGMYTISPYQGKESGNSPSVGNGPNALVYNTTTVQLLASVGVDPPSGGKLGSTTGEYREVVRYEFAPAGVTATTNNEFYIYVSHYKSSSSGVEATNEFYRNEEAVIIRNDEANNLPANSRVIYVGDYNITASDEASYQNMLTLNAPNGIPRGQGIDPFNPTGATNINWGTTTTSKTLLAQETESSTDLRYRDDLQIMTTNIYYGTPGGLALVPGTYHGFGNNGTTPYKGSVASGSDTALNSDLGLNPAISASQLYQDLSTASDHLPIVADYTIPVPVASPSASFNASPTSGSVPLMVMFTDNSTGGITNYFWNFGDGTTTNLTNSSVLHTYATSGVFDVTEIVSGPGGSSTNTQPALITVLSAFQQWQLQYFGCTNCPQAQPTADADGTGQDNYFKFVAGLNPTNASVIFVLSAPEATSSPGSVSINFGPAVVGRLYAPQFTTNLNSGGWTSLTLNAANAVTNGDQVTFTDTNTTVSQKFYRVGISLQ